MACYTIKVINPEYMTEEYLSRCVIDPVKRKVYLYANTGSEREVSCDTVDEFMNVLKYIRSTLSEEQLSYSSPL